MASQGSRHLRDGSRQVTKKLNEDKLRRRFFATSAAEAGNYEKGEPLSYRELLELPDKATVWAYYNDDDFGVLMNDVYRIRRSYQNPDQYYLEKDGAEPEIFQQVTDARLPQAHCLDKSSGYGELVLFHVIRG